MKSLFKKRIVDERMELQSLRNARKSWNFLLLATGFCLLAELHLLRKCESQKTVSALRHQLPGSVIDYRLQLLRPLFPCDSSHLFLTFVLFHVWAYVSGGFSLLPYREKKSVQGLRRGRRVTADVSFPPQNRISKLRHTEGEGRRLLLLFHNSSSTAVPKATADAPPQSILQIQWRPWR